MKRPIAISLSPNTEKDDVRLALKTILSPRKWFDDNEVEELELEFARYFGKKYKAIAVNSGRSAEFLILKCLGIGKGDEVAIQAFTCVAVPNSILWVGARPLYIDIDSSYNMDPRDLIKKINEKTKALIVQHTFGIPAEIDKIKKIAEKNNAFFIEDCSHALGASYQNKKLGTFGEISFFSFGRDKIVSSVFGGMILCSNKDLYEKVKGLRDKLDFPPTAWVLQQLLHPIAFSLILPVYNLGLGKLILALMQKANFLSKAVYSEEKICLKPKFFPAKMPGALAHLAKHQLAKLDKYNGHRLKITEYYFKALKKSEFILPSRQKGSIWLRFPIRHEKAKEIFAFAKAKSILLGDWYREAVTPVEKLSLVGYTMGNCPVAEDYCETIINLPTYPILTKSQAENVINLIKK